MSTEIAMQKRGYLLPLEDDSPNKEMVLLVDDLRVIFASGSARPSADAAFLQKPYKTTDLVRVLSPLR
jgi:hypothetical protein